MTGNPDRFRTGRTVIRARDDGWRTQLSRRARVAAAVLSWPLARRYGYRHYGYRAGPAGHPTKEETVGSRA